MEKYSIKYFENKSQSIKVKEFETMEQAISWGKKELDNFYLDLIHMELSENQEIAETTD